MKDKKMKITDYLIIITLIVIICATLVALTSGKYTSQENNQDSARIAKWNFSTGDLNTKIVLQANKDKYPNLKEGTIAPGSSGSFDIYLDASGSDVGVNYEIKIEPQENQILPTGLTISADSYFGTIKYDSNPENMKKTINVVWQWTNGDEQEEENYDQDQDVGFNNNEAGQTAVLNINITGKQMNPNK